MEVDKLADLMSVGYMREESKVMSHTNEIQPVEFGVQLESHII